MLKQKVQPIKALAPAIKPLVIAAVVIAGIAYGGFVHADKYDDKIRELEKKSARYQDSANDYAIQARSYQDAVNKLQEAIDKLQSDINDAEKRSDQVKTQIEKAKEEIKHFKSVLGESIRTMYEEGQISTLEILASSDDLSDFVNKQEYRSAVQDKVKTTLDKITTLKADLEEKQRQLAAIIREKKDQQDTKNAAQAKQARLLAYSASQKATFDNKAAAANAEIDRQRSLQWAAYNQLTGGGNHNFGSYGAFEFRNYSGEQGCGGGYAYCWAGMDEWVDDSWGLHLARECVHYAADRAARGMNLAPYLAAYYGAGNAENWPNSLGSHFRVDHSPEAGAVAVVAWPGGGGHAMYVESVLSGGWVHVSQMNWAVTGQYSTMDVKSSGVLFVHFH